MSKGSKISTKKMIQTAMLGAVATVVYYLDFPIPLLLPPFIKMDLSNVVSLFASFSLGPAAGVIVCFIKNAVQLLIKGFGTTMGIGNIFDFVTSAAFAFSAGLIYKKIPTRKGAFIACAAGCLIFSAIALPLNYFIVYPIYAKAFGGMEAILGMYREILPDVNGIFAALCIFNEPFTFVKGVVCAALTLVIYKPLMTVLRRAGLMNERN